MEWIALKRQFEAFFCFIVVFFVLYEQRRKIAEYLLARKANKRSHVCTREGACRIRTVCEVCTMSLAYDLHVISTL